MGEAGTDSPFPPRGMEGERKMFQAQAQGRTLPWQGNATSLVLSLLPCPAGPVCPAKVAASPWELVWGALARC